MTQQTPFHKGKDERIRVKRFRGTSGEVLKNERLIQYWVCLVCFDGSVAFPLLLTFVKDARTVDAYDEEGTRIDLH